jgi:hypothetical protein
MVHTHVAADHTLDERAALAQILRPCIPPPMPVNRSLTDLKVPVGRSAIGTRNSAGAVTGRQRPTPRANPESVDNGGMTRGEAGVRCEGHFRLRSRWADDLPLRAQASASAWTITSAMRSGTSLGRKKTCPGTVTT